MAYPITDVGNLWVACFKEEDGKYNLVLETVGTKNPTTIAIVKNINKPGISLSGSTVFKTEGPINDVVFSEADHDTYQVLSMINHFLPRRTADELEIDLDILKRFVKVMLRLDNVTACLFVLYRVRAVEGGRSAWVFPNVIELLNHVDIPVINCEDSKWLVTKENVAEVLLYATREHARAVSKKDDYLALKMMGLISSLTKVKRKYLKIIDNDK